MNCPHCGETIPENSPRNNVQNSQERDEVPSDPDSGSIRTLLSNSTELLRKTAGRGNRTEYPAEFEAGWSRTSKYGSKYEAFLVWKRVGRPSAKTVGEAWGKWSELEAWKAGYSPQVVRWLRGRCFEQEPSEPVRRAGNGTLSFVEQRSARAAAAIRSTRGG